MTTRLIIIIATFFILLLGHQNSLGQDTNKLFDTTWTTLKTQLLRRASLGIQFGTFFQKNRNNDPALFKQLKAHTSSLIDFLNSSAQLDSIIITKIHEENDSLFISIEKGYGILLNDKSFIQTDGFIYIVRQLEEIGNNIYIAAKDFNKACLSIGRQDLRFKKL